MKRDERRSLIIGLGDLVLVPMAYAGAYFLRFGTLTQFRDKFSPVFLFMLTASYLIVFYFFDLYSVRRKIRNRILAGRIVLAVGASAVLASLVKYLFFLFPIGRGILAIANALLIIFIFVWRNAGFRLLRLMGNPSPVLLVGKGRGADEIAALLGNEAQDYIILGRLADDGPASGSKSDDSSVKVIGPPRFLGEMIKSRSVGVVVLTETEPALSLSAEALLHAHHAGVDVVDVNGMYQRLKYRIPVDYIKDESWFLQTRGFALADNHGAGRIKRIFDVGSAGLLFLISLPLWPLISLMIKLESKGPVFYKQNRIGKNETIFCLHKFRSMIEKAEDDEPVWAQKNDRRATRVGRILRKLHLDELPQLWNVLRGDMSLVGPRPERPEFVAELKKEVPFYALRHFVKPGLTGWAQINYAYAASTKDSKIKLEYDLYYISRMNLLFDLKIIILTIAAVLSGRYREG
jgi:exopolysaccharide biosynthesis polyprenyl glycosylphosphotransferase